MTFSLSRRSLGLGSLGALLATFTTGAAPADGRRFLFVHAEGGWDPLCVFAAKFGSKQLQMEADAQPMKIGNFNLVDHPGRPAVRKFFERFAGRALVVNGISTRSVNHEVCQAVALTGATSDNGADWPTLIAAAAARDFYLPHAVLNGPAFAGAHTVLVTRAEGRVEDAVKGKLLGGADEALADPLAAARGRIDAYLASRAGAFAAARPGAPLAAGFETALKRARALSDAKDKVNFPQADDLRKRTNNAIQLLADGVTRCATISTGFVWDSHADNSNQIGLFETLFADLAHIVDRLDSTPSGSGKLADNTVVVVLSEMGRTPAYNSTRGRDHWPYTSALLLGPGIKGGRAIGGYSDLYTGIGVHPSSAEPDPNRPGIDARALGATLLALANIDPKSVVPGGEIIQGALA